MSNKEELLNEKPAPKKRGRPKKVKVAKAEKVVETEAKPVVEPIVTAAAEPIAVEPAPAPAPAPVGKVSKKARKKALEKPKVEEPKVAEAPPKEKLKIYAMNPEAKDALSAHMKSQMESGTLSPQEIKSQRMKLMNRMSRKGMTLAEAKADIA